MRLKCVHCLFSRNALRSWQEFLCPTTCVPKGDDLRLKGGHGPKRNGWLSRVAVSSQSSKRPARNHGAFWHPDPSDRSAARYVLSSSSLSLHLAICAGSATVRSTACISTVPFTERLDDVTGAANLIEDGGDREDGRRHSYIASLSRAYRACSLVGGFRVSAISTSIIKYGSPCPFRPSPATARLRSSPRARAAGSQPPHG